jgi:hypothetical protein
VCRTADDVDLLDLAADLRPGPARHTHRLGVDHLERPAVGAAPAAVEDDHALAALLTEEVRPARVEPERLVGEQADRSEDRHLGDQKQSDPSDDGPPVTTRQPWPPPHRADEQQHGGQNRQH